MTEFTYKLWQWYNLTAVGEAAIIEAANQSRKSHNIPLRDEYRDNVVITTIEEAARYFLNTETGSVARYSLIDGKETKDKDWY